MGLDDGEIKSDFMGVGGYNDDNLPTGRRGDGSPFKKRPSEVGKIKRHSLMEDSR